ncbi:hypothetical protein [Intestinibacter bartlettii]|uniref:Uncharacterized protein n=1 Tax=Intestinibacter bartlettii CAG:1329 TaxID=1263063 RepID=R5X6B1_9FIRM|nr:hypothetical protein [Intestinibacter bartlettii]CDA11208.1 unknown [Intestinibacter bartlettii CAG:1329]
MKSIIKSIAYKLANGRKDLEAKYRLYINGIYVKISTVHIHMYDELNIDARGRYYSSDILRALEGLSFVNGIHISNTKKNRG